jgi:hypothetical protein
MSWILDIIITQQSGDSICWLYGHIVEQPNEIQESFLTLAVKDKVGIIRKIK